MSVERAKKSACQIHYVLNFVNITAVFHGDLRAEVRALHEWDRRLRGKANIEFMLCSRRINQQASLALLALRESGRVMTSVLKTSFHLPDPDHQRYKSTVHAIPTAGPDRYLYQCFSNSFQKHPW